MYSDVTATLLHSVELLDRHQSDGGELPFHSLLSSNELLSIRKCTPKTVYELKSLVLLSFNSLKAYSLCYSIVYKLFFCGVVGLHYFLAINNKHVFHFIFQYSNSGTYIIIKVIKMGVPISMTSVSVTR